MTSRLKSLSFVALAGCLGSLISGPAASATVNPGDILVSDVIARTIVKVDPVSGAQTQLVAPGSIEGLGLAVSESGDVFVAAGGSGSAVGTGIYQLQSGGALTPIVLGAPFIRPVDMVMSGVDLLIADNQVDKIFSVDTGTGLTTEIASGVSPSPDSIALDSNGNIIVADLFGPNFVTRIDRGTGAKTVLSTDTTLGNVSGIAVGPNDEIYALTVNRGIFEIDANANAGSNATLKCGPLGTSVKEMTIDSGGNFLVVGNTATMPDPVIIVNSSSCAQTTLTAFPTAPDTLNYGPIDIAQAPASLNPEDQIIGLIDKVIGFNLKRGISNALDSKLENALAVLEDANENNNVAAVNGLYAFINHVNAQRGGHLTEAQADELVAIALQIIDELQGS